MVLKAFAALILLACSATAQDADAQVRGEIQRLRTSLQARPITDPRFADSNATTESQLKGAEEAAAAGRLYVSLERLVSVSDFVRGIRTTIEKTDAVKDRLAAFEDEWRTASAVLVARDQ